MRFLAIFLVLLVAGYGWALWRGIDVMAAYLERAIPDDPVSLVVEDVELTAAEEVPGPLSAVSDPVAGEIGTAIPESLPHRAAGGAAQAALPPAAVPDAPAIPSPRAVREASPDGLEESAPREDIDVSTTTAAGTPSGLVPEPAAEATIVLEARGITGEQVNLRQGPDMGTASLRLLSLNDPVEVLEAQGDWLRVRTEDGQEGWVAARFVAAEPS